MFICVSKEKSTNTKRSTTKRVVLLKCDSCGDEFKRDYSNISKDRLNNNYKHVCNKKECWKFVGRLGSDNRIKNNNFYDYLIGTKIIDVSGYIQIYVGPDYIHQSSNTSSVYGGRIREHIYVMQNHLDRSLIKGEVVHHIDGNKQNNDISNLDLLTVQEHNNCHAKSEVIVFELYRRGLVGYDRNTKLYFLY